MSHPSLKYLDHRPWPLPAGKWAWRQSWLDLAFLHWPIDPPAIAPLLPSGLELDLFDRQAWIGVVPFRMTLQRRGFPLLPGVGAFAEINVRTYVRHQGRPGVWFFSLDAASGLAVWGGRQLFHLPYYRADINCQIRGDAVDYVAARRNNRKIRFAATYQPTGEVRTAPSGSLEHWLTERYCLFSHSAKRGWHCGDVHHIPWPLQQAEVEIKHNSMLDPLGLTLPDTQPLAHYAKGVDVALWDLRRAG